jgi:2-aminoadipate transaminase
MQNDTDFTALETAYRFAPRSVANNAGHGSLKVDFDFSDGYAFPRCLPDISREAVLAAAQPSETMQYSDVFGVQELREQIVDYVARDGVVCSPENILIVNGAKHGLDLACRVFIEPGDGVIVTAPTYMTALSILRTHEVVFWPVGQDDDGVLVDELETKLKAAFERGDKLPKLFFDVPDFHNPTGLTTSLARRHKLLSLAREFGFILVEDDPYRRIRFEGQPVAPIKSLDTSGLVIALGTASKILAPGLRIGWVIADEKIIQRMAVQKADGGTSPFNQRVFVELLRGNEIEHHIDVVTEELRKHRDIMMGALRRFMPETTFRVPEGGYYLWLRLPGVVNADELAGLALERGVKVYSGRRCYPGEPLENALRLCYSYEEPEQIEEGIERLSKAYSDLKNGTVTDDMRKAASDGMKRVRSF